MVRHRRPTSRLCVARTRHWPRLRCVVAAPSHPRGPAMFACYCAIVRRAAPYAPMLLCLPVVLLQLLPLQSLTTDECKTLVQQSLRNAWWDVGAILIAACREKKGISSLVYRAQSDMVGGSRCLAARPRPRPLFVQACHAFCLFTPHRQQPPKMHRPAACRTHTHCALSFS